MARFTVTITRSHSTEVSVEADSPEAAAEIVNRHAYPLPALEEWSGHKDWIFTVYDEAGTEILEKEA